MAAWFCQLVYYLTPTCEHGHVSERLALVAVHLELLDAVLLALIQQRVQLAVRQAPPLHVHHGRHWTPLTERTSARAPYVN